MGSPKWQIYSREAPGLIYWWLQAERPHPVLTAKERDTRQVRVLAAMTI